MVYKRNQLVGKLRRRPCSSIQVLSHLATFYCIGCFGLLIQPSWLADGSWAPPVVRPAVL